MRATWKPHEEHGELTERSDLPDSVFAFPNQRKEPMTDARHVRNAIARFDQTIGVSDKDRDLAFANIKKAANHYDVDMSEADWKELGRRPSTGRTAADRRRSARKAAATRKRRARTGKTAAGRKTGARKTATARKTTARKAAATRRTTTRKPRTGRAASTGRRSTGKAPTAHRTTARKAATRKAPAARRATTRRTRRSK